MQTSFDWQPTSTLLCPMRAGAEWQADAGITASAKNQEAYHQLCALRALIAAQKSVEVTHFGVSELTVPPPENSMLACTTSGTSGTAKSILRTQESWRRNFAVNGQTLAFNNTDCAAVFGTLSHSLALYGVLEAAHHGASILSLHGLRPDRQRAALLRHPATILYLTPTQLGALCSARSASPHPVVRCILVGGGPLSEHLRAQIKDVFPNAQLIHFYGAAETSFIAWSSGAAPAGSVGHAYPDVTITIRDAQGNVTHGIGEIWVKSPYLFDSYITGQSEDTRRDDSYLSIGECGWQDAQGHLFVAGRKSRMITIADVNVFPEMVETCLARLVRADQIVVMPRPDAKRGQHLIAVIAGAMDAPDTAAILRACRQQLGPLQAPRRLYFVPQIATLPAGKPDYGAIGAWLETIR